jgi:PAS domain S-box-containing protein
MMACSVFYYMDVIIDYAGWVNLKRGIFYTVHDLHRALFLIPVMYATYEFRMKGIIVTSFLSLIVFLPRALIVSPYPNPVLRSLIFTVSMVIMGVLLSKLLNNISERKKLEQSLWQAQNDLMLKRAETAIKESERLNSEIIEKLNEAQRVAMVGSWEWNLQTYKVWWSDETYVIFGVPKQEYVPSFEENSRFIHPDDLEKYNKIFEHCLRNGEPLDTDLRLITPEGQLKYCHVKAQIIFDDSGQKNRFIGTVMDITERKLAEELLRENERKLKEAQEMAHLGYWHWDVKTGNVKWSEEVYKIFCLDPKEFTPQIDSILALSPWPDDHQRDKELINRAMETHCPGVYEQKFLRPDKSIGYYSSTFQGSYDEKGDLISIVGSVMDITERKLAEEKIQQLNTELEQKVTERTRELHDSQLALLNLVDDLNQSAKNTDLINRRLEETNKELGAFSYSVSHDLRAPLRSIDGFSLALMEEYQEKLDDTGKNYLNRIRTATQHMGLLIEDILKLSKVTHAEFHYKSIDLSKIVQSIAKIFQQDNPDKDMKITIQEGIVINGDYNSMQIALTNLLENACKFTGKQNNPLIEFGMTTTEGKKVFFVRDNGVGFDMAYADKLFGAFQRLHGTDEFPGTGIGLATVKRIITRHGGQIWAEGEVGKGATFFFTIPE